MTRFLAAALPAGCVWLAGVPWTVYGSVSVTDLGAAAHGSAHDAMPHAIFLGFVTSTTSAHAPVVVPAVVGRPLPYTPRPCLPSALLHASLPLRVLGGDAAGNVASWRGAGPSPRRRSCRAWRWPGPSLRRRRRDRDRSGAAAS